MALVRELNRLKRRNEANAEFARISIYSDTLVDVSRMAVFSAIESGDFSEAIATVERLTTQNPDDIEGWIFASQKPCWRLV